MILLLAIADAELVRMFYEMTKLKLNYLISYHYLKGQCHKLTTKYRHMIDKLYLDSGAYSVATGKSSISILEYSLYINKYGHLFDEVFNLDEAFDDPELNCRNQLYLEGNLPAQRKRPIPVLHDTVNPIVELEVYVGMGHEYIAIGSNKKPTDAVFETIKTSYPNIKIHMFGTLNRKMLLKHRPFSADAASYAFSAKYGVILYWDPDGNKEYPVYVGRKSNPDPRIHHFTTFKLRDKFEAFLKSTFNYDYQTLLTSTEARWMVNFYFMKQLEDYLNTLGT